MLISFPHVIELASGRKISLRAMTEDDLLAVVAIENLANASPWSVDDFKNSIASSHHALVVEIDSACNKLHADTGILAFAVFSIGGGEAEVLNIAVAKKARQQSIAKNILKFFIESLVGQVDNLFLEVRESNQAAIALYDGLGFNQVGLRSHYYPKDNSSSEREDALIFAYTIV